MEELSTVLNADKLLLGAAVILNITTLALLVPITQAEVPLKYDLGISYFQARPYSSRMRLKMVEQLHSLIL